MFDACGFSWRSRDRWADADAAIGSDDGRCASGEHVGLQIGQNPDHAGVETLLVHSSRAWTSRDTKRAHIKEHTRHRRIDVHHRKI